MFGSVHVDGKERRTGNEEWNVRVETEGFHRNLGGER